VPGKQDWLARGLPTEGEKKDVPTVGEVAREDAVACHAEDRVATVRRLVEASPYDFALVLSDTGVLLGRLGTATLEAQSEAPAEELMEPGPSTVRPGVELAPLVERLRDRGLEYVLATMPDGKLAGVMRRADAEARLAAQSR
jgi:CBS-domain-containing membrane protein